MYGRDPDTVHPHFLRTELRLARINIIHRFTRPLPFKPTSMVGTATAGSLFRDSFTLMAAATTLSPWCRPRCRSASPQRLQGNATLQQASYGFTIFTILGPICTFSLVVVGALFNLVEDLPLLLGGQRTARGLTT